MEEFEEDEEDEQEDDEIRRELVTKPAKRAVREAPAREVKEAPRAKPAEVTSTAIVTQTSPAFKLPNGEVVTLEGLFLWMSNEILAIRRAVA